MKKNFMDKLVDLIDQKLVPPMTKFANLRPMQVVRRGMMALIPMILISSIFLILFMLGSPSGTSEQPLISFLAPYVDILGVVYDYGLAFLSLYSSVAFGIAFANVYKVDTMITAILSLNCFIAMNINMVNMDATMSVANFGGAGLFGCMLSSFLAGYTVYFCEKRNFSINLPDTVPPEILSSFKGITPFVIAIPICWFIRTVLNFDITIALNNILGPIFSYADTPLGYGLYVFVVLTLWSVGIHGDSVMAGIADPLTMLWGTANTQAAAAGVALTQLPHVWSYSFQFFHIWVATFWPLVLYMLFSKVKAYKAFGRTVAVPTFFICEPMMFGAPVVLNPMLFIPMILSGTVSGIVSHLIMGSGLINKIFVNLPWTTPQPLQVLMSTGGDFKAFIIPIVSFIIGLIIYYPFFKAYEKKGLAEERETELKLAENQAK